MHTKIAFITVTLIAASLTVACNDSAVVDDTGLASAEVVSAWLDALEAQDVQASSNLMTDDVVWETRASFSGDTSDEALSRQVGKEAVVAFFSEISTNFETTRFSDRALFETEEDVVFAELKGDFRTRVTGQPYQNLYMFKVRVDGDRVARIDEYFNPIHAAKVLGIDLCPGS